MHTQRNTLLRILAKRIIVDTNGELIGHELHSPFVYLTSLSPDTQDRQREACGLSIIHLDLHVLNFPELPTDDVGHFLSMLKFEQCGRLAELGVDLASA